MRTAVAVTNRATANPTTSSIKVKPLRVRRCVVVQDIESAEKFDQEIYEGDDGQKTERTDEDPPEPAVLAARSVG